MAEGDEAHPAGARGDGAAQPAQAGRDDPAAPGGGRPVAERPGGARADRAHASAGGGLRRRACGGHCRWRRPSSPSVPALDERSGDEGTARAELLLLSEPAAGRCAGPGEPALVPGRTPKTLPASPSPAGRRRAVVTDIRAPAVGRRAPRGPGPAPSSHRHSPPRHSEPRASARRSARACRVALIGGRPEPARLRQAPEGLSAGAEPARVRQGPEGCLPERSQLASVSGHPRSEPASNAPATVIESQRMPSIAETTVEMIEWVFPEHAGGPGQIHGGRMMEWITKAGTLAASRVARGTVVLGAMDDIDFLHPVKVGQIAILRARVEDVGTSSLEVGVRVFAEDVLTGERRVTLNSHLVFVKVDESVRPRPVEAKIRARDGAESALVEGARARREQRLARFARRASRLSESAEPDLDASDVDVGWRFESVRSVLREDALFGNTMFVGKMLMALDEAGGILSMRYCKGLVMTACVDAMDFYSPIFTHEVVTFKAGLNHVGTSSLEVGVKVLAEVPWSGEVRHACTAFLSFVHLGPDLRPRPCPPYTPTTAGARRRWEAALGRRAERLERVKELKAMLLNERG